ILVTYDANGASGSFDLRGGEILILVTSACWAWYSRAAQSWLTHWSQLRISCITMVPGAVVSALVYVCLRRFCRQRRLAPARSEQCARYWLFRLDDRHGGGRRSAGLELRRAPTRRGRGVAVSQCRTGVHDSHHYAAGPSAHDDAAAGRRARA